MNEAEYLMENYGDRGRCSPSRPSDVALSVAFLLFLPCFKLLFRIVLILETSEISAIFVFTTKTAQPCPQVLSVKSALTCKEGALSTSSVD